jgi:hypothetical protein
VFRLVAITQYGAWRSPISAVAITGFGMAISRFSDRDHRLRHGDH